MLLPLLVATGIALQPPSRTFPVQRSRASLTKVEGAWWRKIVGDGVDVSTESLRREAKRTWYHVRAARMAMGDGQITKARASYNSYLARFRNDSAVLVADVCLRLAILEHNQGNLTGAQSSFRLGARTVASGLQENDSAKLRERGATLFCSWGLHEYKYYGAVSRSRSLFEHASRMDRSKAPILNWQRFRSSDTRLAAVAVDETFEETIRGAGEAAYELPGWKKAQLQRYNVMADSLLHACAANDADRVAAEAAEYEIRLGSRTPARLPRLLGSWRLAYAAPVKCCACPNAAAGDGTNDIGAILTLYGPDMRTTADSLLAVDVAARCTVNGQDAAYGVASDSTLDFIANAPWKGLVTVTYVDDRVLLLRRANCGSPLLVLERHSDD